MRAVIGSRGFFSLIRSIVERIVARLPAVAPLNVGQQFNRFAAWVRTLATAESASGDGVSLAGSATLNAQFWLSQYPWRPTAGWAAVAAFLSAGLLAQPLDLAWSEAALLLLLVDPLWGSIWRLAGGRAQLLPLHEHELPRRVWLPYMEAASPAALFLGRDDKGVLHLLFRVGLPTLALAFALAAVLGPSAVWLTAVVVGIAVLGWISRHVLDTLPALLHSVITIALPWMLVLLLFGLGGEDGGWRAHGLLALLWLIHNWGEGRVLRNARDRAGIGLMALADIGIALLMALLRVPLWLAVMAVLWLPTWLSLVQGRPMTRLNIWWLLAMLVSAAALGQNVLF